MKVLILPFLILVVVGYASGQELNSQELQSAAVKIRDLVHANYVFPDKGSDISRRFYNAFKKGHFQGLGTWSAFAAAASDLLKEISHDGHMYARYEPATVRDLMKVPTDTAESFSHDPFYYGDDAVARNFGFDEVKILPDNIGYLKLSEINISSKSLPVLYAAMNFVTRTKALIIDLRNNHGGGSAVGSVLESYFLPPDLRLLDFRTRRAGTTRERTVSWLTEEKYNHPLFILINNGTASAAEAFAFALQSQKRAVIVGQPSAGAAHMNSWYPVNEHIFISISTGAPTLPDTVITWEQRGIQPDHLSPEGKEIEFIRQLLHTNTK